MRRGKDKRSTIGSGTVVWKRPTIFAPTLTPQRACQMDCVSGRVLLRDPRWLRWRLSCAPGFALSACLIAGQVVGVTELVLDRAEHAE